MSIPMRDRVVPWLSRAAAVLATMLAFLLGVPGVGFAAVTVSRAELSGDRLRVEGTAIANRAITVDGVAMGTSDGSGQFRIDRSGYTAPADCTVDVNDGSAAPVSTTLSGCTPSSPPGAASLSALTLSQTRVVGGTPVTGTVTLTSAAGSGGVVVTLSSDNPTAATVPASVTVPAGTTSANFPVTTNPVQNSQSTNIIGTAGGVTRHSTLTVTTQFDAEFGTLSLGRGGLGHGRVTSEPPGIDCTFTSDTATGSCSSVPFPDGTEVRLTAVPEDNSTFVAWRPEPSCPQPPTVLIRAGTRHICTPAFALR